MRSTPKLLAQRVAVTHRFMPHWFWIVCAIFPMMLLGAAQAADAELKLKAAYVQKIADYVDWPEGSRVMDAAQPITLCVAGAPAMSPIFRDLALLGKIKNKPLFVVELAANESSGRCDIVYLGSMPMAAVLGIIREDRYHPILTFGDTPGYAEAGVLFNFYPYGDQIRFEVNLVEARDSGLKISSRLLKLARIVER